MRNPSFSKLYESCKMSSSGLTGGSDAVLMENEDSRPRSPLSGGCRGQAFRGNDIPVLHESCKLFGRSVLMGMSLVASLVLGAPSVSPAAPVQKIGVVNLDKILHEYKRTLVSDKKLEEFYNTKQSERERLVSEIKNLREEMVLLNEESRRERQQQMEGKMKGLADFDRESKDALQKARDQSVKEILDEVEEVVSSFSKEQGFDLVISSRAVLYGVETLDLTDPILTILNDRYAKKSK